MKCTWAGCEGEGTAPQIGRDGQRWALLCQKHKDDLDSAIASQSPPRLMQAWIKAQGGAKAAAERTARCAGPIAAALVLKTKD